MKQVTLNIPDSKFKAFLEFIKTLDYVQVEDNTIPQWQQEEVNRRLHGKTGDTDHPKPE